MAKNRPALRLLKFGWAAILIAMLAAGCRQPPALHTPTGAATPTALSLPSSSTGQPTPGGTPLPTPQTAQGSPLFPGLDLVLQAELPRQGERVDLYRLTPEEKLSPEDVSRLAAGLGIQGSVYIREEHTGSENSPQDVKYLATDGLRRLFIGGSAWSLEYQAMHPASFPGPAPGCTAPCAPAKDSPLRAMLGNAGLLPFEYETSLSEEHGNVEELIQHLDGLPIIAAPGSPPQVRAILAADGQPLAIRYQPLRVEPAGSAALISAAQAWQNLLDGRAGVVFHELNSAGEPWEWLRLYPEGVTLTAYAPVQVYRPAENGAPALILFNGYPLSGNIRNLEAAAAGGRLVQIWGRLIRKNAGQPELQLDGWQTAVTPETSITGVIARAGEQTTLTAGSDRYLLPDAPAGIEGGTLVTARGVALEDPSRTFEWYSLKEGPRERVRRSGPGLAASASEAPVDLPAGGRLDGIEGVPEVIVHLFSDGSSQVEVQFVTAKGAAEDRRRLDGPGMQGIDAYHRLPVRLWGRAGTAGSGTSAIQVERYEPLVPGLKLQAWLGLVEAAGQNGAAARLFNTVDGEQYAIQPAQSDPDPARLPGALSEVMIVEGYVLPGQAAGGLPVIHDVAWFSGIGRNDLEGYQIRSAAPLTVNEPGAAGARRKAVIDAVQLAYYLPETGRTASVALPGDTLLPVWRFSGFFEDGSAFEILVRAVL